METWNKADYPPLSQFTYGKRGAPLTVAHELKGRKEREEGRDARQRRVDGERIWRGKGKDGHQLSLLPCLARKKEPVRKS